MLTRSQTIVVPAGSLEPVHVASRIDDLKASLVKLDWRRVEQQAIEGLALASASLSIARRQARARVTGQALIEERGEKIRHKIAAWARDPQTRPRFADIKATLEARGSKSLERVANALDHLATGEVRAADLDALASHPGSPSLPVPRLALGAATTYLEALVHAGFNRRAAGQNVGQGRLESFLSALAGYRDGLRCRLQAVQGALIAGGGTPISQARELWSWIEDETPAFAALQGSVFAEMRDRIAEGRGGRAEALARPLTEAGDFVRVALAAYASAHYLAVSEMSATDDADARRVVARASSLAFNPGLPNGADVELSRLEEAEEGRYVQVRGVVKSLSVGRGSDQKLWSRAQLSNPSSGAEVTIRGMFVHFAHVGVVPGAPCTASGTYRRVDNVALVDVERPSVRELETSSWTLAFLRLGAPYFERLPGGHNIAVGLSPHAPTDEHKYRQGAGELLFRPTVRSTGGGR